MSGAARRPAGRRRLGIAAAVAVAALGLGPVRAPADILPPQVIDGPANAIFDVDGAALASDGTGGVVYRTEVDGVIHVFAVPVDNGNWGAPTEVDPSDLYGASQPAIAAGDNGRLLVVWVQPRAITSRGVTIYELMSATMGPGASSFGPAIMVDPTVSEPYTGDFSHVDPQLAMAGDGDAYVAYRVVDDDCEIFTTDVGNPDNSECPATSSSTPTAAVVETRVARFNQGPWTSLGEINRAPQLADRLPSTSNEPSVAIGNGKAGLVVWQEPDQTGIARIWARRLFGTTLGNVIELSPTTINNQSVGADADSPAAAFNDTGLATATFRLQGGNGSPLGNAEIMSQTVPGSEADITAATDVGGGPGISGADLAENDDGQDRIAYELGGQAFATNSSGADPVALGAATGGPVATTVDPDGGGVSVWPGADSSGLPEVDVLDQFPTGGSQSAQLVADLPGPITGQSVGVAPGGDAVIAWMQGAPGDSEVVGDVVSVAPHTFTVTTPTGWQSAAGATVTWNPAAATTTVTYAIYVDGRLVLGNIAGPPATAPSTDPNFPSQPVSSTAEAVTISRHLPVTGIGTGVHEVQVVATDALGQTLASSEQKLKLDDTPPQVSLATADDHHAARVTVSDPDSGVAAQATRIDFGVGATVAHKVSATHVYNAPGTYPVTVHAVDKAGNATTVELKVTVR